MSTCTGARTAGRQGLTSPDYPIAVLATAVAAAALIGANNEDEAVAVISRVPGLGGASDGAKQTVARWIANMYPPSSAAYWGSFSLICVGDRHIAEVVRKRPTRSCRRFCVAQMAAKFTTHPPF